MIRCENLVKIYKVAELEVVALQGLDLTVPAGELLGIVGASGSGKSTLLNVLGGLDRPSAGRVTVNGRDLLKLSDAELDSYRRQEVGFVWQQTARNLIPYLSAPANVQLPMTVAGFGRKEKKAWTQELLEAIGLWDFRNHRLVQLSGGQQQRIAIAVALANKPKLLLGDEPTGELDSVTAQEIMGLFQQLNQQYNLTTIIVTHDPQIARAVDRVITLRDGRTSSETVKRVADVEAALMEGLERPEQMPVFEEYFVVDAAGRLQIPPEVRQQSGIGQRVTLEVKEDGVLVKPVDGETAVDGKTHSQTESTVAEDQPAAKQTRGLRRWLGKKINGR